MIMPNEIKYGVALIRVENKYYLVCGNDGTLTVRDDAEKMSNEFTAKYMINMNRGYEASASTALNAANFEPSILEMSIKEMSKLLDLKKGVNVSKVSAAYGSFYGLECKNTKNIEKVYNSGIKPKVEFE